MLSSRQRTRQTKQRVRKAANSEGPARPSWALSSRPRTASSPAHVQRPENTLVSEATPVAACRHHVHTWLHLPGLCPSRHCDQCARCSHLLWAS